MSDDRKLIDSMGLEFFGPKPWGPAIDEIERMVAAPVQAACLYCEELIATDDSGVFMMYLTVDGPRRVPEHRECFLRHVFGSVGHQRGKCSCYGGTEEDPEGMTKREAARAAVRLFEGGTTEEMDGHRYAIMTDCDKKTGRGRGDPSHILPLYYDREGKPMTVAEWAIRFEDMDYRRIGLTELPGNRHVSTVWLGIDHAFGEGPPLIFESMAFHKTGKPFAEELDCKRYSTEAEARTGHEAMVQSLLGNSWSPTR